MNAPLRLIKLHAVCEALGVRYRDARYVLERGFVPTGISPSPGSGEHRDFSPHQAFWLGLVLHLKAAGLKTPLAAQIADYADEATSTTTQNLSWDLRFCPRKGRFDTEHRYFVEVADSKFIRLVTDACPSQPGLYHFDWHQVGKRRVPIKDVQPYVLLRIDISLLAAKLGSAFNFSETS